MARSEHAALGSLDKWTGTEDQRAHHEAELWLLNCPGDGRDTYKASTFSP